MDSRSLPDNRVRQLLLHILDVASTSIDKLLYTSSPQYPRCPAHRHKSFCILHLSVVFQRALRSEVLSSGRFPKAQGRGYLIRTHTDTQTTPHITISSCVRCLSRWLPRSNDLFLTYLTLGRCISETLDLSFVFETGWHMDWMAIWSGVWLREMVFACGFFLSFFHLFFAHDL